MFFRSRSSFLIVGVLAILLGSGLFLYQKSSGMTSSYSSQEMSDEDESSDAFLSEYDKKLRELADWKRPEGPFTVALQAGHWKASEAPEEFPNLRKNTGTSGGGTTEWEVNLQIAEKVAGELVALGIDVEILPATIPPEYFADLFIAIHADGNLDTSVSGYKAAAPRRDMTRRAADFVIVLEEEYEKATGLRYDPNVSGNMRGYYAFNWRRYVHSLHPMTTAVILETGFLTNANDRRIIVHDQEKSVQGIVAAILRYKSQHSF
jgi:hypothetical protein